MGWNDMTVAERVDEAEDSPWLAYQTKRRMKTKAIDKVTGDNKTGKGSATSMGAAAQSHRHHYALYYPRQTSRHAVSEIMQTSLVSS